jgi:ankyrin repeat protein
MEEACTNSHFHVASYLISHMEPSLSPILTASEFGNVELFKYTLNDGQGSLDDRDEDGNTPLHLAAQSGWLQIVQFIIEVENYKQGRLKVQ